MRYYQRVLVCMICGLLQMPLQAQVLREAANDPNTPAYSDVRPQDSAQLRARIKRMQALVRELQQNDLSPEQKQAALDELIRDHNAILRQHDTWLDWQKPQTVDSATLLLEKMIFEQAADMAPTVQAREQVLRAAPGHLALDPNEPQPAGVYEPPLLEPIYPQREKITARPSPAVADTTQPAAEPEPPPKPTPTAGDIKKTVNISEKVQVAVLADDKTTSEMHDDNTVLRDVTDKRGELVLFGTLKLWLGGAIQLDSYIGQDLFTFGDGGDRDSDSYIRRGEGILRASVFEHGEVKVQYDFDANIFRNLYWRWVSSSETHSVTIGNQKEPIGQDWMVGSKFTTALEPSAPTSAFSSFRSKGIRYNGYTALASKENPFKFWGDNRTYVNGSIGLFGEDIENTNDTDWAVTGRVVMGGNKTDTSAFSLGMAASYRHGEYDRIAPRPGLQDVNRIPLARPDADTQALLNMEGMFRLGSLHSQVEAYYSDYSGGEVDARGWGGYAQVGWLFGGKHRHYRPRWGLWTPIDAANEQVFEVFGRISLTHGNDDVNSSNELYLLTLGGNWYYRKFRVDANIILADTKRDILDQSNGHALALRLQYMF